MKNVFVRNVSNNFERECIDKLQKNKIRFELSENAIDIDGKQLSGYKAIYIINSDLEKYNQMMKKQLEESRKKY